MPRRATPLCLAALVAVLAAGCGADSAAPRADAGGTPAASRSASAAASASRAAGAPTGGSPASVPAGRGSASAAASAGASRSASGPGRPSASAAASAVTVPVAQRLLLASDLGAGWETMAEEAEDASTDIEHRYCGEAFGSDARLRERRARSLRKARDAERVQQEGMRYAGDGAVVAMREFRDAFTRCGTYTSGSGASAVRITVLPFAAPAYGDEIASALLRFELQPPIYAAVGAYRQGEHVFFMSYTSGSEDRARGQYPWAAGVMAERAALRGA